MTMFTLDLVREFAKLEGLDAALVLDDLLGAVARRFVPVTTLREKSLLSCSFYGC